MVFVSKNIFRKCKYCEKEKKKNITSGRHKGFYTTCGSKECLRMQYDDLNVCALKGRIKNPKDFECFVCEKQFKGSTVNHRRYCLECVPNNAWRGRAQRYKIGKPQWEEMERRQNYMCALCERKPEVIDHCHTTGKVRGLLCNKCNNLMRHIRQKAQSYHYELKKRRGKMGKSKRKKMTIATKNYAVVKEKYDERMGMEDNFPKRKPADIAGAMQIAKKRHGKKPKVKMSRVRGK